MQRKWRSHLPCTFIFFFSIELNIRIRDRRRRFKFTARSFCIYHQTKRNGSQDPLLLYTFKRIIISSVLVGTIFSGGHPYSKSARTREHILTFNEVQNDKYRKKTQQILIAATTLIYSFFDCENKYITESSIRMSTHFKVNIISTLRTCLYLSAF